MPYLTSTPTGIAGTGFQVGFGVPGLAHPLLAPAEWAELARPGTPLHWVVLDVAGGPGTRPDTHCLEAAARLRTAGVRVLGRLDIGRGLRTHGDVLGEAQRYADWYRVDGWLLDRCPASREDLPAVRRKVAALRRLRDDAHIVLGHGTHPYPGYAETADQMVTFTGPWSHYRWSQTAEWTADYPPDRFCHFVHGVPRPPPGRGAAPRPLARRRHPVLHRPIRPRRARRSLGDHARLLGRNRLADRNRCLGMKKTHGSVTRRTTVVIDRPTESPCRCHPWSSRLPSSP
ncbi:hypothetical protein GCM10020256_24880 [Streptomyces thermocoprophilus]